eukprot:scaffold147909_cov31-Tisochrysis_lutea.AAC.4
MKKLWAAPSTRTAASRSGARLRQRRNIMRRREREGALAHSRGSPTSRFSLRRAISIARTSHRWRAAAASLAVSAA